MNEYSKERKMGEVCLKDMENNFNKLRDSQLKMKNYKKLECF